MNIFYSLSALLIVSLSCNTSAEELMVFSNHQQFDIKNTCIVQFDDSVSKFEVDGRVRGMLAAASAQAKYIYKHSIKGFAVNMNCEKAKLAFANDTNIVRFEEDKAVVAFPRGGKPDKGKAEPAARSVQIVPWGIEKVGTADGQDKTAWIIDTGIDLDHPDLNVDTTNAFSAFSKGRDSGYDDRHGHGTHVAGTIAAKDDGFDVIGVAAGAKVVPVKVLDGRGSGSTSGVIAGVDHVAAYAAPGDCANMSLGGGIQGALDDAVNIAVEEKRIFFVVAAGNNGADANNYSPARAARAITVSAIDDTDHLTDFSNWGSAVNVAAPGSGIISLNAGGGISTPWAGTSMAAPHVCGVVLMNQGVTTVGNITDSYNRDSEEEGIINL